MISPSYGLNPDIPQIYPIVNAVFKQMTGQNELEAVDTATLIAMGTELENLGKKDIWLNTLAKRVGYTIDGYRMYESRYKDLHRSQLEWGAYVQKLYAEMPDAVEDKSFDVGRMDGQSVDQWIINNPKVRQKFFEKEAPFSFFITIQTVFLKEAFLSQSGMAGLINLVFGQAKNKINYTMEELGRLCVNNFILSANRNQHFHLVTIYNNTQNGTLTTGTALNDPDFQRWAVGFMNMVSKNMEEMSVLYNDEGKLRFTPKSKQRFYILTDFMNRARTNVLYAAFNKEEVTANPNLEVSFWQEQVSMNEANALEKKMKIAGSVYDAKGAVVEKTLENVLGLIFDYDAMGMFRKEEEVLTTPVNARARYYNTFWHENQMWFNDHGENCAIFFLD